MKTTEDDVLDALKDFKAAHMAEVADLRNDLNNIEKILNRPGALGGSQRRTAGKPRETWIDAKSRRPVAVLAADESLAALEPRGDEPEIGIGRLLRGIVLGGRAHDHRQLADERKALGVGNDTAGGYTVTGALAREWVDLLRAQMVLTKAGARTVPMEAGELTLARVTADPNIVWHGEGGSITPSEPTFGAVRLTARTAVCVVKFSLELAQDSANIEEILQRVLTASMAQAIDSAGLVGVTVDAGAAPSGIFNLSGRNTVTSIGAPTSWDWLVDGLYELALDNVPLESVGALIGHPAVWRKMVKLRSGLAGDNTPLTMPAEVAALPKLWTTAAPLSAGTASAVIGHWPDLLMGVRQDLTVKLLQERFLADTLEVAMLIFARVDFAATRADSFCTLEGLSV